MSDTYLLHPEKFDAVWSMLKRISKSSLLPEDFQAAKVGEEVAAANLLTPYTFACRMGMDLMQVCQSMHKINGKMTLSAQMIIAAINSSGKFIGPYFKFLADKRTPNKPRACYCYGYRKSEPDHVLTGSVISIDTALSEGWAFRPGSKWDSMRGQMLRYRAVTIWARAYCPEVLMGFLHSSEEMEEGDKGYDMSQEILVSSSAGVEDKSAPSPVVEVPDDPPAVAQKYETPNPVSTTFEESSKNEEPAKGLDGLPDAMLDAWAEEFETESEDYPEPSAGNSAEKTHQDAPRIRKKHADGTARTRRIRKPKPADEAISPVEDQTEKTDQNITPAQEEVAVHEAPVILP